VSSPAHHTKTEGDGAESALIPAPVTTPCLAQIGEAMLKQIRDFLRSEDGPTAVEYAVMLALIVVVCLSAVKSVGTNAKTTFTNVAASLAGS
jgi:pilus assembly protein Flp/PilA